MSGNRPETAVPPAAASGPGTRYRMLGPLADGSDDYWVANNLGQRVLRLDGRALRARGVLVLRDAAGAAVREFRLRPGPGRDAIAVEEPSGAPLATVTRTPVSPLRDRIVVRIGDGLACEVLGNILGHEYRIGHVAKVSHRWFRRQGSYGVEVGPGQDETLFLVLTLCIDRLVSDVD